MEEFDIKTIIYFVIAILWLLFSTFKKGKAQKERQEAPQPTAAAPEIKKKAKKKILYSSQEEPLFSNEANLQRSSLRNSYKMENQEINILPQDAKSIEVQLDQEELKKMVIYSEILKRPVY
jgi:hypothetical protein